MTDLLHGLNDKQKEAVLHTDGPVLVLAGAGSGKTKVLTVRIANLVATKKCKPEQILAVTFTNKATKEMQERMQKIAGVKAANAMTISTFHSLGVQMLREFGDKIGIKKNFTIIDTHEQLATIKSCMRGTGAAATYEPSDLVSHISLAKNGSLMPDEFAEKNPTHPRVGRVYKSYINSLRRRSAVDFDDLLLLPLQLLRKDAEVLAEYRKRYHYISVDEYQDTNKVQVELAFLLATPRNNILVVGDDDQGIYSWRGADINNILSFKNSYPGATTILLNTNYRSTRMILRAASEMIQHNRHRIPKDIRSHHGDGEPVRHYGGDDEIDEASWIGKTIFEHNADKKFKFKDHAILVRTNAMMRRFEEGLRNNSVPYKVVGSRSFYDRKEIRDVLAYIRFFANQSDELSLTRIMRVPNRGISKPAIEALEMFADLRKMPLWDAVTKCSECQGLSPEQINKISEFGTFCTKHIAALATPPFGAKLRDALTECGFLALMAAQNETGDAAREHVEEILHGVELYEQARRKAGHSLSAYLQELMLLATDNQDDAEKQQQGTTIMTIHKSKGLEFPVVFVAGLDNDIFPSPRAIEEGGTEEERRLFYVAMTRAEKLLFLTYPSSKLFHTKLQKVKPTSFCFEIPEEFLDGKFGEAEDENKEEFLDDFFAQMQLKLAVPAEDATTGSGNVSSGIGPS